MVIRNGQSKDIDNIAVIKCTIRHEIYRHGNSNVKTKNLVC
jgi:hypothetical protein